MNKTYQGYVCKVCSGGMSVLNILISVQFLNRIDSEYLQLLYSKFLTMIEFCQDLHQNVFSYLFSAFVTSKMKTNSLRYIQKVCYESMITLFTLVTKFFLV
jgi:hypothetical protein